MGQLATGFELEHPDAGELILAAGTNRYGQKPERENMSNAPAGWYDDGSGVQRYWDGLQWLAPGVAPAAGTASGFAAIEQQLPLVQHPVVQYPAAQHPGAPLSQQPALIVQQPYGVAPVVQRTTNGMAVAGFVIGLVSMFLPLVIGLAGGTAGLVLSIIATAKHNPQRQGGKGLAITGIILSALAIILIL